MFFRKKLDMTKPHELSFGQIDPPRPAGGYAIRDGLAYVPRYTADKKVVIQPFQLGQDRNGEYFFAGLNPKVPWRDVPALENIKKRASR